MSGSVQPSDAVDLHTCWWCDEKTSAMLVCGQCRVAAFCDKICQTSDWQNPSGHRPLCQLVVAKRKQIETCKKQFEATIQKAQHAYERVEQTSSLLKELLKLPQELSLHITHVYFKDLDEGV